MKVENKLLSFLWKFTKLSFIAIGILMGYISKATGRVWKETAKPSQIRYKWWWEE
ncbi:TPA: hypothetical protein U1B14_001337 [Streptococcus suis]|uniref:hypothetical protein n=1 Tax=Streptococcus TaxID=1301 RepID=UPI001C8DEA3E|nr:MULTISPECIES: hypothetical protein [Streptococcus]MBY0720120.1 hypothetical protein [Streptococcus sp. 2018110]MCO8207769.1 hypothetical protein [Streptococcus suis]MCO8212069.1 hypothetical protein [Streptococcus suis]MCO8235610.1 hypothetical protein [Streptococcus suis]MDG3136792.1 hypothetical protein [Streptococcus suis]